MAEHILAYTLADTRYYDTVTKVDAAMTAPPAGYVPAGAGALNDELLIRGDTVLVRATRNSPARTVLYTANRSGHAWADGTQSVAADGPPGDAATGLSADAAGTRIVAGQSLSGATDGKVYWWTFDGTTLTPQTPISPPAGFLYSAAAISPDGNWIVALSTPDTITGTPGSWDFWKRSGTTWSRVVQVDTNLSTPRVIVTNGTDSRPAWHPGSQSVVLPWFTTTVPYKFFSKSGDQFTAGTDGDWAGALGYDGSGGLRRPYTETAMWNPAGTYLATVGYYGTAGAPGGLGHKLRIFSVSATGWTAVASHTDYIPYLSHVVAWSTDGARLYTSGANATEFATSNGISVWTFDGATLVHDDDITVSNFQPRINAGTAAALVVGGSPNTVLGDQGEFRFHPRWPQMARQWGYTEEEAGSDADWAKVDDLFDYDESTGTFRRKGGAS